MEPSIKHKLIASFVICFSIVALSAYFLVGHMFYKNLVISENHIIRDNVTRLVYVMDREMVVLATTTQDWGNWDDMYNYVHYRNKSFENSNLTVANLSNTSLTSILIIDPNGKPVYSVAVPSQVATGDSIYDDKTLNLFTSTNGSPCGFIKLQRQLQIVCWHSIRHSNGKGPPAGTLVMSRNFDNEMLGRIRTQVGFDISIIGNYLSHADEVWKIESQKYLVNPSIYVNFNESSADLIFPVLDVFNQPVASFQVSFLREIFNQVNNLYYKTILIFCFVALAMAAILFFSIQYILIKPLVSYQKQLSTFRTKKNWNSHLRIRSKDEIGKLGTEINTLLEVICKQLHELEHLSLTDSLTSLANRRSFDLRLQTECARIKRKKGKLSLIIIDIDFFKQYNDHYGHAAGDRVIQAVADCIKSTVRRSIDVRARINLDKLQSSRIGGEEFAILLPDTDEAGARHIIKLLFNELKLRNLPHEKSQTATVVTISAGVTSTDSAGCTPETLFEQADQALYAAKLGGRNRFIIWSPQLHIKQEEAELLNS